MTALDDDIEEDTIHCATCGVQVSLKKAMVHMEKCFMKVRQNMFLTILLKVLTVGGQCVICRVGEERMVRKICTRISSIF